MNIFDKAMGRKCKSCKQSPVLNIKLTAEENESISYYMKNKGIRYKTSFLRLCVVDYMERHQIQSELFDGLEQGVNYGNTSVNNG